MPLRAKRVDSQIAYRLLNIISMHDSATHFGFKRGCIRGSLEGLYSRSGYAYKLPPINYS